MYDQYFACLGLLRDRDRDREDALVVAGCDPIRIEAVAEQQLSAERAVRALGDDELVALRREPGSLGRHGQSVLFDGQIDGVWVHTGEIEVHDKHLAPAVSVHWHPRGSPGRLLRHAVDLAEGV